MVSLGSLQSQLDRELDAHLARRGGGAADGGGVRLGDAAPSGANAADPNVLIVRKEANAKLGGNWDSFLLVLKKVSSGPLADAGGGAFVGRRLIKVDDQIVENSSEVGSLARGKEVVRLQFLPLLREKAASRFQKGDRIRALWPSGETTGDGATGYDGGWFKGRVQGLNADGTYVVAWDDGSTSEDFRESEESPMQHLGGVMTLRGLPSDYTEVEVAQLLKVWRHDEGATVLSVAQGADAASAEVSYDSLPRARAAAARLHNRATRPRHAPLAAAFHADGDAPADAPETNGRFAPY